MTRYARRVPRPRATHLDPDSDWSFVPYLEVDGPKWTDTGLLWPDGTEVWRGPEPLGFGKREGIIEG